MSSYNELRATIKDARERVTRLNAEAMEVHTRAGSRNLTAGETERFERLMRGVDTAAQEVKAAEDEWREKLRAQVENGTGGMESGDGSSPAGGYTARGGDSVRDQARRTIEAAFRSKTLPDYAAERATDLVSTGPLGDQDIAARWAVATGSEHYRSAFTKLLADPGKGHMLWTGQEQDAYRAVAEVKASMRALSTGTGAGAEMLPLVLDPSIMLTSGGSSNPLRQLGRVVQTVSNSWRGVTSAGVTAEWKVESAQAADATPTLAEVDIPNHFGDAYVPYSFEVGMDALNFSNELSILLNDAADQLQAAAFMNGTGSGQPSGVTLSMPSGSKVTSATADAIVAADVVKVQNALPPRFQAKAQWVANLTTINTIGSFETTNGSLRFPEVANGNLLHRPLNEGSYMGTAGATTTAGNDNTLLYGDFKAGFVITDRIGSQVEIIQNLVGANMRPTGQRGVMLWFRTGSLRVVDNAFRLLTA